MAIIEHHLPSKKLLSSAGTAASFLFSNGDLIRARTIVM
jgi:hypothetical protein